MRIFFSMGTDLYFTDLEKEYKKIVENRFGNKNGNTVIKLPSDYMDDINKITVGMKRRDRERYISTFFLKKVEECDVLIYTNTYTKDGNVLFSRGVRGEIGKAIELGKDIYRLYLNGSGGLRSASVLQKMDMSYFDTIVKSYDYSMKGWILKSVDDYIKFYRNNKDAIQLLSKSFESNIGRCVTIPHHNYVYEIENFGTGKLRGCKKHNNSRHSIILLKQELTKYCPYTEDKWIWADYSTVKLNPFPSDLGEFKDLIAKTRTLHKLMYILKDSSDFDSSKEGIAYVDKDSGKIPFERGKPVKDYSKIIGVRPIFDIDIKDEFKVVDAFFEDSIFNEYQKTIDLFLKHYELDNRTRMMFSGNGLYIDLGEHLFSDFDCNDFSEFDSEWSIIRKTMQEIMNENGVRRLQIEKGYGWNRYFKVAGTFHAKSERISIPLDINESLDRKWLNDITKIELGLEQNVFNEIINKAGNNWR